MFPLNQTNIPSVFLEIFLLSSFAFSFNWAKGNISKDFIGDSLYYEGDIKLIQKYINSNFTIKNFEYISNDKEFETLLNDFLDLLVNIKDKYFKNLSEYDCARKFVDELIYKNNMLSLKIISKEDYLKGLKNLNYFDDLKNKTSFLMIVFYVLIQYRLETIKHHIFGKFSKAEKTYQNILNLI